MHGKKEDCRKQANIPQAKVTEQSLINSQEAAESPEIELLFRRALKKILKPETQGQARMGNHEELHDTSSSSSVR